LTIFDPRNDAIDFHNCPNPLIACLTKAKRHLRCIKPAILNEALSGL